MICTAYVIWLQWNHNDICLIEFDFFNAYSIRLCYFFFRLHLYSVRGKRLLLSNYQSRLRGDVNACNITQKMELITKARVLTRTIKFRKVINIPENPLFTKSNSSFCVNALPSVFTRSLTSFSDINLPISSHWQHSIVKRNLTTSYIR